MKSTTSKRERFDRGKNEYKQIGD